MWNDQFCNSEATSTGYQKGDGSFNEKQIEYGTLCRSVHLTDASFLDPVHHLSDDEQYIIKESCQ